MKKDISELMRNQEHMLVAIKYLNERVEDMVEKAMKDNTKDVEDILESQEMIDKLIVKNSDDILLIKKAKDENAAAIRHLEMQIDKVDKEIEKAKETVKEEKDKAKTRFKSDSCVNKIDCRLCEKSFTRYVDLENHIESCHEKPREFQCDQCDKNFLLKWRLRKHMRLHEETNIKHCHYFINAKSCLYEKLVSSYCCEKMRIQIKMHKKTLPFQT